MNHARKIITSFWLFISMLPVVAQVNTGQVMRIGQNALYFEDYMVSIQYFNQVIAAKPYLAQPYFFRAIAKLNLDDYQGAEADADMAIEHNPFIVDAYEVRGVARQNQGKLREAVDDYTHALTLLPENRNILFNRAMAQVELGDTAAARESYAALVKAHPSYDNGYLGRARLLMIEGDTVGALADLDKAISINPNATNAYVMRADVAINSGEGDFKSALDDMDRAIKLQPRHAGLFINRAFLRYKLDDYFGAMADYDYAIQLDPLNAVALFNRGLMRAELKDNDRAIQDFTRVLSLKPGDARALYNRAMLYRDTHQYKKAMADIDKVIEAYPDLAGAYYLRFDINRALGNMRQSEKDYNKSMALAKHPVVLGGTGQSDASDEAGNAGGSGQEPTPEPQEVVAARFSALLTVDNSSDALEQQYNNPGIRGKVQDRNINVEIEPIFALSYYYSPSELRPSTYYIKEVDNLNATRILRKLLLVTNSDVPLTDQAEINRHFSDIEYYNSYIATHTPRAVDYFGRGMAQMTVRNYQGAIADFDKALQLTPDFALAWFQRGIARYRNHKTESNRVDDNIPADVASQMVKHELSEAISDLDRTIELSPSMPFPYYDKGNLLVEMQDYTSALAAYTQAIEAKPDFGEAYYNRGYVYLKLGNKDAGTRDLSKAGELGVMPSYNLLKRMRE